MREFYSYPIITISIVNLDGENYLNDCLKSIENINYPKDKTEVIVVDNGSKDNSIKLIENSFPWVKTIKNTKNLGFSKANNQAAEIASGEYIAFLNNDTKVDENWLIELLKPLYGSSDVICSGSKVLSFDGKTIDFACGMINFEGKGFQIDNSLPIDKDIHNFERYMPFVNGGAMLIKRDVFIDAGGFDEDFFAYYEDVDLGWRLWILGYKVVFTPKSIVYHMYHGTSKNISKDKLRFLSERNALISVFKNYDENNLASAMSATLANIFGRIFMDYKFDYKNYYNFDLNNSNGQALSKTILEKFCDLKADPQPLSSLMAVKDFLDNISKHRVKREKIQNARKREDKVVFNYFKGQFYSISGDEDLQQLQIELLRSFGIYDIFGKKIKRALLIISDGAVESEMTLSAIRVWNFAKVMSKYMNVILAIPNKLNFPPMEFEITRYTDDLSIGNLCARTDILLFSGAMLDKFENLKRSDKYLILDIYNPYNLTTFKENKDKLGGKKIKKNKFFVEAINKQLSYGDYFICASEKQRSFWVEVFLALKKMSPGIYRKNILFNKIMDVVPFGLPENKPIHTKNILKGVIKGIDKDDFVVLCEGGIYNWFEMVSIIRAMKIIWDKRKDVKLFFMGIKQPGKFAEEGELVKESVELAKSIGIYKKNLFFDFENVKYDEKQNYLMESDAAIIIHPDNIEKKFSFKTSELDYIWAGLPMISIKHDIFSGLVDEKYLGIVIKEIDSKSIANAIVKLAEDKEFYNKCVRNLAEAAINCTWDKVCAPVLKYCINPTKNITRNNTSRIKEVDNSTDDNQRQSGNIVIKFLSHLFHSGPKKTFKYVINYLNDKKLNF